MSNGVKGDQGKPPIFRGVLVQFPRAIQAIATLSDFGANKYSWDNWRRVDDGFTRYSDAMVRHITEEAEGKVLDDESGFLIAVHTAWNALARLEIELGKEHDERHEKLQPEGATCAAETKPRYEGFEVTKACVCKRSEEIWR